MSRVIRTPQLAPSAQFFGGGEPRFYDDAVRVAIDEEVARAFEAGRREGFDAGRADTMAAVQRLDKALSDALAGAARLREAAVDDALDAAFAIAEFVLGSEVLDTSGSLMERIRLALSDIDDATATVFVNPSDWDVLGPVVQVPHGVTIERDPSIRPGEARIEGPWATAELTRAAAMASAREALS